MTTNGSLRLFDDLSYIYNPLSNHLLEVTDKQGLLGFNDRNKAGNDYDYDLNGNMVKDLNKKIGATANERITYNYLNLPTQVIVAGEGQIDYTYDAAGVKQTKTVTQNGTPIITEYAGGFVYRDSGLEYFPAAEGYATRDSNGNFEYIYQYKDHLGNVRLSYSDANQDGTIASSEVIEETAYYPFGMQQAVANNVVLSSNLGQKIKYNSKELQEDLSLNLYDYGARNYDSSIGRWFNVDPIADKYYHLSPYVYVANSPIVAFDPDGRSIGVTSSTDKNGNTTITVTLTGKAIDLTGKMHMSSYVATLSSNLERAFNGSHRNHDGSMTTVRFISNIKVAEKLDDIGENDHVF